MQLLQECIQSKYNILIYFCSLLCLKFQSLVSIVSWAKHSVNRVPGRSEILKQILLQPRNFWPCFCLIFLSLCWYTCLLIFVLWKQDPWAKAGTKITYGGEVRLLWEYLGFTSQEKVMPCILVFPAILTRYFF